MPFSELIRVSSNQQMESLMKTLLTTTFAAAAMIISLGSAAAAAAEDIFEMHDLATVSFQDSDVFAPAVSQLPLGATIAVARLDGGRLIPTPFGETEDWTFLDRRIEANIVQLGATHYIKYIPELPLNAEQSSNKIDEIRLTAANEGYEYVLMYGLGYDADWASFGGQALDKTGLHVKPDCAAWEQAKAKALLINSFTGDVLGAATADNIEFNIGELADEVEYLIDSLSARVQTADTIVVTKKTDI